MPKIGFIDHHLNNYHANTFLRLLHNNLASEGARVVSAWESDPTGDDWCAANSIERASSIQEVLDKSDVIILLAPDNIDVHLKLAQQVLPAGKPTFIDKFLAPNKAEAQEIVSLAKKSGAPIFSSSAVRYSVELEEALPKINPPAKDGFARGMGQWDGYGIHTLSLIQRIMGAGVKQLADTGTKEARLVTLDYGGGRRAFVEVRASGDYNNFSWQFGAASGNGLVMDQVKQFEGFYLNLMSRVAEFFKTRKSEMSVEEALEAVSILEAADRSLAQNGAWVEL